MQFVLDGDPIDIDEFFRVNTFTAEFQQKILSMEVGETKALGGQGCFTLKRVQ